VRATLAVTNNRRTLRRNTSTLVFLHSVRRLLVTASVVPSSPIPLKCRFLQEPHDVTSQKTPFFIVTAVKTLNFTDLSLVWGCRWFKTKHCEIIWIHIYLSDVFLKSDSKMTDMKTITEFSRAVRGKIKTRKPPNQNSQLVRLNSSMLPTLICELLLYINKHISCHLWTKPVTMRMLTNDLNFSSILIQSSKCYMARNAASSSERIIFYHGLSNLWNKLKVTSPGTYHFYF
jgi:hypothetical protein